MREKRGREKREREKKIREREGERVREEGWLWICFILIG